MYTQEPPQVESPVYDDDGQPPFPNPAAAVAPPPAQPAPQPTSPQPAYDYLADVTATLTALFAKNPLAGQALAAMLPPVQNAQPTAPPQAAPHPAFDPDAAVKKEAAELKLGLGHIHREFTALQQAPLDVLLTAAAHLLDVGRYVVLEYAKRGHVITLRQAILFTMRTFEAAEGKGIFGLIHALDAHGPAAVPNGSLQAAG